MIRYLLPRIVLPLLAVLALEGLFRSNFWERFAAPDSHAGLSIRVRHAVQAESRPLDFVTLGSSRAVYGLDHKRIAERALRSGVRHANLSMPGSHWMSVMAVIDWLQSARPELQGGIIALSLSDMQYVGNGNYELAIARPFVPALGNNEALAARFDWKDSGSYGSLSALYQYRGDIQDLLLHPLHRLRTRPWRWALAQHSIYDGPRQRSDICAIPWDDVAGCAAHLPVTDDQDHAVTVCQSLAAHAGNQADWSQLDPGQLPRDRQEVLQQRQRELRAIGWKKPPLVILMPITHHWSRELMPKGAREWAHMVLDPLVAEGSIRLLDYSDFFDRDGITRCDVFWDLYHQNEKGLTELTDALLPEIESYLYDRR